MKSIIVERKNHWTRNVHSRAIPADKKSQDLRRTVAILFIIIAVISLCVGCVYWKIKKDRNSKNVIPSNNNEQEETTNTNEPYIEFEEQPAFENAEFFEKLVVIGGEQAYIAFPLRVKSTETRTLIIYNHGSNTTITSDMNDSFMKDMRFYAEFFTKNGYAFAASSEHGANWGNKDSVQDIENLRQYVKERYPVTEQINLLGFSMGGLPTLNYVFNYPVNVRKMALLAPTTRPDTWGKAQVEKLMNIDIKIWHGNRDVNVPLSLSQEFVALAHDHGKVISLEIIDGSGHFDIDTELSEEILAFFNELKLD